MHANPKNSVLSAAGFRDLYAKAVTGYLPPVAYGFFCNGIEVRQGENLFAEVQVIAGQSGALARIADVMGRDRLIHIIPKLAGLDRHSVRRELHLFKNPCRLAFNLVARRLPKDAATQNFVVVQGLYYQVNKERWHSPRRSTKSVKRLSTARARPAI